MSADMIFLIMVLGIAGLHLLFSLVDYLAKFGRRAVLESRQAKGRDDDWYVFFKKSALYGKGAGQVVEPAAASEDEDRDDSVAVGEECHSHKKVYA